MTWPVQLLELRTAKSAAAQSNGACSTCLADPCQTQIEFRLPWDALPWEVSKCARMTLLPSGIVPLVPVETRSSPSSRSNQNITDVATECFRRAGIRPLKARDEAIRPRTASYVQCVVKKWITLFAVEPSAWEIAKQTYGKYELLFATGGIVESVSDALAGTGKGNSTLHGRAAPLLRYTKF